MEQTTELEKDAASRRVIEERSSAHTTEEQDRHTAGQRLVSLTWERTQRFIAVTVTVTGLGVASWHGVMGSGGDRQTAASFIYSLVTMVIGFYFGRTNHTRVGSVGGTEDSR